MKRLITIAAGLAVALTGTVASAQDGYRGHDDRGGYDRDHGRGDDRRDDDRRGDDRRADYRRGDYRRDDDRRDYRNDRRTYARYARGQRYRGDGVYVSDYGRYGYRAPPRGYRYYRTNQGDVVLAAIATGIIASVIASNSRY